MGQKNFFYFYTVFRIAGISMPSNKKIFIALTYIYGIGKFSSKKILDIVKIPLNKKVNLLSSDEVKLISKIIDLKYEVENSLKSRISKNIKNLINIKSYRGSRHLKCY